MKAGVRTTPWAVARSPERGATGPPRSSRNGLGLESGAGAASGVMTPEGIDSVFLELRAEGLPRDSERVGRARLVPCRLGQRHLDRDLLGLGQREVARVGRETRLENLGRGAARAHDLDRKMRRQDPLVALEQDGALDHVPELPDVPRPAVREEQLQRLVVGALDALPQLPVEVADEMVDQR